MIVLMSHEKMQFKKELSIEMFKIDPLLQGIGTTELQEPIEWCVIHLGYPIMHVSNDISQSILHLESVINFTTDNSEWLHIGIEKESDQ